jgi:cardiolipin synthase
MWDWLGLGRDAAWLVIAYGIVRWTLRVWITIVVLRKPWQPSAKLLWLTITYLVPELGAALYLTIGRNKLSRRRLDRHQEVVQWGHHEQSEAHVARRAHAMDPPVSDEQRAMVRQAEAVSDNPVVGRNTITLLDTADGLVDALVADIDAARHHVHLLTYICVDDSHGGRVLDAVLRAAQRGVLTRVLVDAVGSAKLLRDDNRIAQLRRGGVQLVPALPVRIWRQTIERFDLRNHRKAAVIDGHTCYVGSHNLVHPSYGGQARKGCGDWVDLTGRCTGPVVAQLQSAFIDDWAFETGELPDEDHLYPPADADVQGVPAQIVPTGPSNETEAFRRILLQAIGTAHQQVTLTTPYLIPDEPTMLALAMAVDRGVAVKIVIPAVSDQLIVGVASRHYYAPLMNAGVQIHLYQPGLMHTKSITVDDTFAVFGSANIDIRSFTLNFELSILLYGPSATRDVHRVQEQYLADTTRLDPDDWQRRPTWQRFAEDTLALLSPIL